MSSFGSALCRRRQLWNASLRAVTLLIVPRRGLVVRFFAEITKRRIRRGAIKSGGELEDAIRAHLDRHNADPKTYVWTGRRDILANERRAVEKVQGLTAWSHLSESDHLGARP